MSDIEHVRKLVTKLNSLHHKQACLEREERGARETLNEALTELLASDQAALDVPWVSHWCVNSENLALRQAALAHFHALGWICVDESRRV